jgi:hypothetical protein
MLREEAMIFWQSRNRYKSTAIALAVADRYQQLELPVGVLVVDYENEKTDGDFAPNSDCFPSLSTLSTTVRQKLNASIMFSFWPEAKKGSAEFDLLRDNKCIINSDLEGYAVPPHTHYTPTTHPLSTHYTPTIHPLYTRYTLYTIHYTLYTIHYTLYTHYILYTHHTPTIHSLHTHYTLTIHSLQICSRHHSDGLPRANMDQISET